MKHYALLGERLGHSLSKPIHEAVFRYLGIDAEYHLVEIPREQFAFEARRLMTELDGMNVTIPYKQEIMPLLDTLDHQARMIGAINTVVCGEGKTTRGYNTDAAGFMALLKHAGIDPAGKPAYVLGGGGSSKTVSAALTLLGARSVTVVSRSAREEHQINYDRFHALFPETGGVLVNTTPVGMWPHVEGCPVEPGVVRYASGVADIVYNPPETMLTAHAKRWGVPACTGLYMLIRQAVEAEAIWQECALPETLTDQLMKELRFS